MNDRRHLRAVPSSKAPIIAGRVPPHDLDAEAAVISCVMLGAGFGVLEALDPDDFYSDQNGRIWEACQAVHRSGSPIDVVTVATYLRDRETLAMVGGPSYLAMLSDATPNVHNVNAHASAVLIKSRIRRVAVACHTIAAESYGDVGEPSDWLSKIGDRVSAAAASSGMRSHVSIGELAKQVVAEARASSEGQPLDVGRPLPTGLAQVDEVTGGLRSLTFVAAPQKGGKTTFALNLAINVAAGAENVVDHPEPVRNGVAVFSLEMTGPEVTSTILASLAHIDATRLIEGTATPDDYVAIAEPARWLQTLAFDVDANPQLTVARLRAKVRHIEAEQAARGARLRLVVVDYVQLIQTPDDMKGEKNREVIVGEIGKRLRQLSLEMPHIAWLVLSQLNADGQLRESRALEQHAVSVWILHAAEPKGWDGSEAIPARIELKLARFRRGKRIATTWYHPQFSLFSDDERPRR